MAQQLQTGLIYIENASNLVYRVHELHLDGTDTWAVGDAIQWNAAANDGEVVSWSPTENYLLRIRMTGDQSPNFPEIGDVITGATESGTVVSVEPLADFSAFLTPYIGVGRVDLAVTGQATYQFGDTATDLTADRFRLSTTWAGSTILFTEYGLHTEYSVLGDPLIISGDRAMPSLINRGIIQRNSREQFNGIHLKQTASQSITSATWTELDFGTAIEDTGGLWAESGNGGFHVPAGVARIDILLQVTSDVGVDLYQIQARLKKDAALLDPEISFDSYGEKLQLSAMSLSVTAGEIFTAEFKHIAGVAKNALLDDTWIMARVSEYAAV